MKKKVRALFILAAFAVSLAACGNGTAHYNTETGSLFTAAETEKGEKDVKDETDETDEDGDSGKETEEETSGCSSVTEEETEREESTAGDSQGAGIPTEDGNAAGAAPDPGAGLGGGGTVSEPVSEPGVISGGADIGTGSGADSGNGGTAGGSGIVSGGENNGGQGNTSGNGNAGIQPETVPGGDSGTSAQPAEHQHEWKVVSSTTGDCYHLGTETKVCSCGQSFVGTTVYVHNYQAQYEERWHEPVVEKKPVWDYAYECNICHTQFKDENDILYHIVTVCGGGYFVNEWIDHYEETVIQEGYTSRDYIGDRCTICGHWK